MEMARRLLEGKFHEEDEDEEEVETGMAEVKFVTKQELDHAARLEQFENQIKQVMDQEDDKEKVVCDEIPREIRKQFKLPSKMGIYGINFHQIR